jgi:hypothetical protein
MRRPLRLVCFVVAAAVGAACSDSPTSPTDTAVTDPPYTLLFESTVAARGASTRTFVAVGGGNVSVTLTSTTPAGLVLGVGVGVPTAAPAVCSLTRAVTAAAGASPQLSLNVDAGTYCVQVYDTGGVDRSASFSVSLVHP